MSLFRFQILLNTTSLIFLLGGFFIFANPVSAATGRCSCVAAPTDGAPGDAAACPDWCGALGGFEARFDPDAHRCVCSASGQEQSACEGLTGSKDVGGTSIGYACTFVTAEVGGAGAGDESQINTEALNPLGETDIRVIIGRVIKYALGIVGSLALLMFIYGGGLWLLSGGSSEKIEKGQKTILWATLGLGVIFASYALVNFVIKALTK